MVAKKDAKQEVAVTAEDLAPVPIKAILLADSFTTKFRPITLECPKVLLPLVNTPMIDYTLAWLESADIEEVFVFCCSHSKQIISYLNSSNWLNQPHFSVKTIESHNCISAGDALRLIYERNVITGDFILVSGDTVSNMSLTQALHEHKERRRKDNFAVMTMVVKQSKPSQVTRQTRLGTDELFMAIDSTTKQLYYYEDKADEFKGSLTLDKSFLAENPSICLHNDVQDCYIDICSPEVLSLFTDNFDYQHLRRHFVKGLLLDDIMGYKIFTHEIRSDYAARVDNFRSYDSISKDIIQRWTYPLVPDVLLSMSTERNGIYRASEVSQSRSAEIGPFTCIGKGSSVGDNTIISNSIIGDGCKIGSDVSIDGCYIWRNVTIEDGCKLKHSILCDGVVVKSGAVLEPGAVLSYNVVVGKDLVVPCYSIVSLLPQPVKQDSDEELEYADNDNNNSIIPTINTVENGDLSNNWVSSEIGEGSRGFVWSVSEVDHEEEWRHSVAPIPASKIIELTQAAYEDLETVLQDDPLLPLPDEKESGSESDDDGRDESVYFEKEVEATFLRAVHENIKEDHIILEVNSLRLSYNMALENCASALFYSMMKLALDTPHSSAAELVKNTNNIVTRWGKLLKPYLQGIDDEIEVIMKFEEICMESGKEYAPLFVRILQLLYDSDIIQEEAVLNWAKEKEDADESDKVFVKQSEKFIQWLNEASEEED
ncbi:Armadillo-type fold [Artemisia annua]|uniref:Translation initiation factor eIF2B subunit epsilon n=1 Tax=Artemisia annua TaxID=35608 RepID=A0A2U1L472_ARTAN|nr:Armadillo-type fold [Artemisia annua]PWA72560.1 Armadillo-type fold [Artemisia annua]